MPSYGGKWSPLETDSYKVINVEDYSRSHLIGDLYPYTALILSSNISDFILLSIIGSFFSTILDVHDFT